MHLNKSKVISAITKKISSIDDEINVENNYIREIDFLLMQQNKRKSQKKVEELEKIKAVLEELSIFIQKEEE